MTTWVSSPAKTAVGTIPKTSTAKSRHLRIIFRISLQTLLSHPESILSGKIIYSILHSVTFHKKPALFLRIHASLTSLPVMYKGAAPESGAAPRFRIRRYAINLHHIRRRSHLPRFRRSGRCRHVLRRPPSCRQNPERWPPDGRSPETSAVPRDWRP